MNKNQHPRAARSDQQRTHGRREARPREPRGAHAGRGQTARETRGDRSNGNVYDGTVMRERKLDGPTRGWRLAPTNG